MPFRRIKAVNQPLTLTDEITAWRAAVAQAESLRADAIATAQSVQLAVVTAYLDVLVAEDMRTSRYGNAKALSASS